MTYTIDETATRQLYEKGYSILDKDGKPLFIVLTIEKAKDFGIEVEEKI